MLRVRVPSPAVFSSPQRLANPTLTCPTWRRHTTRLLYRAPSKRHQNATTFDGVLTDRTSLEGSLRPAPVLCTSRYESRIQASLRYNVVGGLLGCRSRLNTLPSVALRWYCSRQSLALVPRQPRFDKRLSVNNKAQPRSTDRPARHVRSLPGIRGTDHARRKQQPNAVKWSAGR